MKKIERIEGNKLYLKNCGFEYSEEYKAFYRTYGNNTKPVYINELNLDMPPKKFNALVEKLRVDAINFRNITVEDMRELDRTMEKVNKLLKEREDDSNKCISNFSVQDMSVDELVSLKAEIEKALKGKGVNKKRECKAIDKRKPSLRIRKSKYLEMYYRDVDGKLICKYIGKINDKAIEKRIEQFGMPELSKEYIKIKSKWENEHNQTD